MTGHAPSWLPTGQLRTNQATWDLVLNRLDTILMNEEGKVTLHVGGVFAIPFTQGPTLGRR